MLDLKISPPKEGDESFEYYNNEKNAIMDSLKRKSKMLFEGLNKLKGVSCQPINGAMYAFRKFNF
jgi:alanine transaminase